MHAKRQVILYIVIVVLITVLLTILLNSRAILLASTLSLMITMKRKSVVGIFLWFTLLLLCVLMYKTDSTKGRLFIYQNSLELLSRSFPQGVGVDNFQRDYLKQQSLYFKNSESPHYLNSNFYLADDTRFAFNDYIQFICETGIIGVVLLCFFAIPLTNLIIRQANSLEDLLAQHIFISILLVAMVTHVFEHAYITAICCFTYLYLIDHTKSNKVRYIKLIVSSLILVSTLWITFEKISLDRELKRYIFNARTGQYSLAIKGFEKLMCQRSCYELCSYEYSKIKFLHGEYDLTEKIMADLVTHHSSSLYYSLLADTKYKLGKPDESIENYKIAISMVPSRFEPRFSLLKLYKELGDTTNESKMEGEIRSMGEKKQTIRTKYIKEHLK